MVSLLPLAVGSRHLWCYFFPFAFIFLTIRLNGSLTLCSLLTTSSNSEVRISTSGILGKTGFEKNDFAVKLNKFVLVL